MLDVHRSNIVGQQHYLIAMELMLELLPQRRLLNLLHDAHDEIACADEWIKSVYFLVAQRPLELLAQNFLNAAHHEVHNRLGCVDYAKRICFFRRISLEETLIDRVEEC